MKTESEQSFVVKATENIDYFNRSTDSRSLTKFVTSRLLKFKNISDSSLNFGRELDI